MSVVHEIAQWSVAASFVRVLTADGYQTLPVDPMRMTNVCCFDQGAIAASFVRVLTADGYRTLSGDTNEIDSPLVC